MTHLPNLIQDLGLILMAAAAVSLLFKKLEQPVVLGYLIAGVLVGPHFAFVPSVKDGVDIAIWAEIGVIFMLFGLGLEFSFRKLSKVGKSASLTASIEILSMLGFGYFVGQALAWSTMDSLFLGGILSISSTTIIARAFDELGMKTRNFASLVFGVLVIEDLIAILLLVLLTSVAATQTLSGAELLTSSLRLGFFLVLWFLLGIYILPLLFKKFSDLLSDEALLIVSIGLCLMMVIVATNVGFSPALGAFVMGSILAETSKGVRIEKLILPVKDLFSAVFFVSVGMLIDLNILVEHFWIIMLLTAVTILGKFISTSVGALISGRSFRSSVQAGMSLAQIGEFSFIIATLGMSLKVTSGFLYPIAVAVSAVTTFTTPYLIRYSDTFSTWLEGRLSRELREALSHYEIAMSRSSDGNVLNLLWREYGIKILLNSVIVVAITLAADRVMSAYFSASIIDGPFSFLACLIVFALAIPFIWAIIWDRSRSKMIDPEKVEQIRRLQVGIFVFRFFIGGGLIAFIVSHFTATLTFSGLFLIFIAGMGVFLFSRFSSPFYTNLENRFISNLTANERAEIEKKSKIPVLAPWSANLAEFQLSSFSPLIAKTLQASGIKEKFGVTVALIERGDVRILAPNRDDLLLPGDKIFLIGTDDQLNRARLIIEPGPSKEFEPIDNNFGLESLVLNEKDKFVGRSIRECGIREAIHGLIVGIEREGRRHLSPDSAMTLQAGDLVWLVGDRRLIKALRA